MINIFYSSCLTIITHFKHIIKKAPCGVPSQEKVNLTKQLIFEILKPFAWTCLLWTWTRLKTRLERGDEPIHKLYNLICDREKETLTSLTVVGSKKKRQTLWVEGNLITNYHKIV